MAKEDEIDLEYVRAQVAAHLPHHVRWNVDETTVDYDFSRARAPLRVLTEDEILGGIDKQWQTLYLFGEEDVSEGGGSRPFLGVELNEGKVYGLDVERDRSPMFLLNSDIDRFVKTFRLFDETIRYRTIHIPDLPSLAAAIDPDAYLASEWRLLADCLLTD